MNVDKVSLEDLAKIPLIGSDRETQLEESRIWVRFFDPSSSWNWYVLEFDGRETFFGLIVTSGMAAIGQFTLPELSSLVYRDEDEREVRVRMDEKFEPVSVLELARTCEPVRILLAELDAGRKGAPSLVELEGTDP